MKKLWSGHGTKVMGWAVAILGALQVFEDQAMELWWTPRGDLLFEFWVDVSNYLLLGAGAVIIRRGYSNSRRAGEGPVVPGDAP